jgi:KaiC domain protein
VSDEDDWFTRAVREVEDEEEQEQEQEQEDDDADSRPAESNEAAGGPDERGAGGFGDGFEDFATAFENAPTPGGGLEGDEEFGVDEGFAEGFDDDGGFGSGFDDEEFDSDIDRVNVGIEGLDEMILGGVPERSLIAAVGGAGTGKTTFGLQFVTHGLERGERCVYITLEETRSRIVDTADEKGWELSSYAADGDLAVVDIDPVEMANSLESISADLSALVEEFGASRLVLDSVSLLEMMYDEPSRRRSEVFEFSRALKSAGVTTMVTSEASAESAYTSRYGIIEYLADAVFVLQYVRPSDFQETRLALEIQKIRDANHSRETKPYEITGDGISVYRQANIF